MSPEHRGQAQDSSIQKYKEKIRNGIYVARTSPTILWEAIRNKGRNTIVSAIDSAERRRITSTYNLSITEPGKGIEEITYQLQDALQYNLTVASPEAEQHVDKAIEAITSLTYFSPQEVRAARKIFAPIPTEHVKLGVKKLENLPTKKTFKYLKQKAKDLDIQGDREIADIFASFHERMRHGILGAAGGVFDTETKTILLTDKMLFAARWVGAHETGHGVYYEILKDQQRKEWKEISKSSITGYAENVTEEHKDGENFAEMYAMYILNKPGLKMWSSRDENIKTQYDFFVGFMPRDTRIFPTMAGISYPLMDKFGTKSIQKLDTISELPLNDMTSDLANLYDPNFGEETISPKNTRKMAKRMEEIFMGSSTPESVDIGTVHMLSKEFIGKNMPLIHRSKRMESFLIRQGIWQKAIEDATNDRHHSRREAVDNKESLLAACGLAIPNEFLDANHIVAYPVFLKNRLLLITPDGKKRVPYKPEVKAQIAQALKHDTIYRTLSPISEVQLDAIRALHEPTDADREAKATFEKNNNILLLNSPERAFSKEVINKLTDTLSQIPDEDKNTVIGFYRIANATEWNRIKQKVKKKRFVIKLDDLSLTESDSSLAASISKQIGVIAIQNNKELSQRFAAISNWEGAKTTADRISFRILQVGIPNKIIDYRTTKSNKEDFITPAASISLIKDFSESYEWFVCNKEEFQARAQTNAALRAKFNVLQEHFCVDSQTTVQASSEN